MTRSPSFLTWDAAAHATSSYSPRRSLHLALTRTHTLPYDTLVSTTHSRAPFEASRHPRRIARSLGRSALLNQESPTADVSRRRYWQLRAGAHGAQGSVARRTSAQYPDRQGCGATLPDRAAEAGRRWR